MKISFGMELGNTENWERLKSACTAMDSGLWRTIWTYDHLYPCTAEELPLVAGPAEEFVKNPIFEGWTLLTAMAMLTSRVRLGTMVSAVTMRHPALLAKTAVTLDHISGGRVDLGLGMGWLESEHETFGVPLGSLRDRSDRLEEGAALIRSLLNGPWPVTQEGRFFQVKNAWFAPLPVQKRLPLLVAGGGEKRTLRTAARYGDASNVYGNMFGSYDEVKHKMEVLDAHCEKYGRDPREVRRTVTLYADIIDDPAEAARMRRFMGQHLYDEEADALPYGEPQRIIDAVAPYIDLGIDEIVFNGPVPEPEKLMRFSDEVLKAFV